MELSAAQTILPLMQRIQDGDDSAMTEFVVRYGPHMRRIAERMVGKEFRSRIDSEDLVQSTHLTLWQGIRSGQFVIPTIESLMALVRTVMRRQISRQLRRAEMKVNIDAGMAETFVDQQIFPVSKETDPHDSAEFSDLMERLLSGFDDIDQRLVRLRFRGFSTADAAVLLIMDPAHLRVRLARLRKKLGSPSEHA
jgi:RNA polymerase sigma factor (sigma-70 family)